MLLTKARWYHEKPRPCSSRLPWGVKARFFSVKTHMKTVTVKIGSSVLLSQRDELDEFRVAHITDQVRRLRDKGIGVILVVSGAVACGSSVVDVKSGGQRQRRMAAGIGQAMLISVVRRIFSTKGLGIAQILLTRDQLDSESKSHEINRLIQGYLKMGIIPVINENDVVDLNSFGGNDFLGARVAILVNAEQYLILSTMAGSSFGVGGSEAKQQTIDMVRQEHIQAKIVNGKRKNILLEALL